MTSFHILGAGSIGTLIATLLPKSCSVSVILRNKTRLRSFNDYGSKIRLKTNIGSCQTIERSVNGLIEIPHGQKVKNLIITTKSYQTVHALNQILHAIDKNTNIMLVHNGMGVYEEIEPIITGQTGPDPNMYLAITTHGVSPDSIPWHYLHNSIGQMVVSSINERRCEMIDLMEKTALNLNLVPKDEFLLAQMEKLIINSYINPLTAILACGNGELLDFCSEKFMKDLVNEACIILRRHFAEITKNDISKGIMADVALSSNRMTKVVRNACESTALNRSSMYQDMLRGSQSEISYINGYIEKLGFVYGLPKARNSVLTELVHASILHRKKILIEKAKEGQNGKEGREKNGWL